MISIFLASAVQVSSAPPKKVQFMHKLKQTAPIDQGPIYQEIKANTEVLKFPGLQQEIRRVVREFWYDELILKPVLETDGEVNLDKSGTTQMSIETLVDIIKEMPAGLTKTKTVLWIHANPGVGIPVSPALRNYIKTRGAEAVTIWLRRAIYKNDSRDYRIISSDLAMRPLFEAYFAVKNNFPRGIKEQLVNFCEDNVSSYESSGSSKTFCAAVLLSEGSNKIDIKKKLRFKSNYWPEDTVIEDILRTAQKWRSEYPKWPSENVITEIPDDIRFNNDNTDGTTQEEDNKNQRGKGHEKGKGKGHDK